MHISGKTERRAQINQSSEKLLSIMELLADAHEPMRLLDISRELHINVSTALRFLNTLIKNGYVIQEQKSLRYYLTFKICNLAHRLRSKVNIRSLAAPYMQQLSQIFGESVCLSIEQNMKVVYIEVVEGQDQMIRSMQRIGSVAPLHCTAVGKLFLSEYSESQLDKIIMTTGLTQFTRNTITKKGQLFKELEKIRNRGFAVDNEECEAGARCISCPIRDHTGKMIAGISVTGPVIRITDQLIGSKVSHLIESAAEISRILGFEPPVSANS
jgi:DNA-binding IclR family transcriptional regulator